MKILISKLPENPWWGHGTPIYENNPAMKKGVIPNQELVEIEMFLMNKLFEKLPVETVSMDFPYILDKHHFDLRQHDFVFVRDLFISNQKGMVVISSFREKARQIEADIMQIYLEGMGYKTHRLPDDLTHLAEGGEFYYCPNENLLFAGLSRNNQKGAEETAALLNIDQVIFLKSKAFHLDTIFTPVFEKSGRLVAVIVCSELLTGPSVKILKKYVKDNNLTLVDVPVEDAIGTENVLGEFAVNCVPLPGYLIGPTRFRSESVDPLLKALGIMHITVPMTQFRLSGGAVHCLTNEL